MNNPFRYGIIVDEPFFIDREQELKDLALWLKSRQSLVMYSPRRFGKSSLILKALGQLRQAGYKTIYIDFFKIHSREKLIEMYYNAILSRMSSWESMLKRINNLVKGLRPVVTFDQNGYPRIGIDYEESQSHGVLSDVLDLPQNLADNKSWVIVFDEFQEINKLNGDTFEKEIRASLIHHDNVSYVFMGSQTHMLLNMFTHKNRAFYQFAKIMELKKIPAEIMHDYLVNRFSLAGFDAMNDIASEIIDITENVPHYVQYLASAVWEAGLEKDHIDEGILKQAVNKIIINQQDYFSALFERLTLYQQKVCLALAQEAENVFAQSYRKKHSLSALSSTQRAVEKLIHQGIIEKHGDRYHFPDPFLKKWFINLSVPQTLN